MELMGECFGTFNFGVIRVNIMSLCESIQA
jgi:hypothetical protein